MVLPDGPKGFRIGLIVLIQYRLWQTASHPASQPASHVAVAITLNAKASRLKTCLKLVLKTKLLLDNRKLYLAYGMVLCLVTLTDLQTRRAGLSASAELLVTRATLCIARSLPPKDVRPSVTTGIVSKRLNLSWNVFETLAAPSFVLLRPPCVDTEFQGEPLQRGRSIHGCGKNWRFSKEIAVYLGNGAR